VPQPARAVKILGEACQSCEDSRREISGWVDGISTVVSVCCTNHKHC